MLKGVQEKSSVVEQFPIIRLCVHVTARQIGSDNNLRVADKPPSGEPSAVAFFANKFRQVIQPLTFH